MIKNKFFMSVLLMAIMLVKSVCAEETTQTINRDDGSYVIRTCEDKCTYKNGTTTVKKIEYYSADGILQTKIEPITDNTANSTSPERIRFTTEHYENGKIVLKREYIDAYVEYFPMAEDNEDDYLLEKLIEPFYESGRFTIKNEYEYDQSGNVVAKWENNVVICEDEDGYIEACDSYTIKYDSNGNSLGKYSTIDRDLIESYEVEEEAPQATKEVKRIYTVEEAAKLVKPQGNTFRIKYK